jgi:hypothetical protein
LAFSAWRNDRPRRERTKRLEPVEIALFSLIVAVALLVAGGLLSGLAASSSAAPGMNGTDYLVEVMTQWASLPLALALLGAMLLAWYQVDRSSSDIDRYEAPNDNWDPGQLHSFELCLASALSHVRRMRFAVVCVAVIAVATAGASIARLAWEFYDAGLGALGQGVQWYTYAEIVIGCIAVVIPALTCIVLGPLVWTRGSRLLEAADDEDGDEAFEDDPVGPVKS